MLEKNFLKGPKIDLHCHLDGSMTLNSISEILGKDVFGSEVQVRDDCTSLSEYLAKFGLPIECIQTEAGIKKAAKDFLIDLQNDNVAYVEARFAPALSMSNGLKCKQIMESVLEGLEEASKECGIMYQVIICCMRHHNEETNLKVLKDCREFLGSGLCAVDLAGDEAAFPTKNFYNLFEYARTANYPFTIHSGECGSIENILLAAEWGAKRIGHGIAMMNRPDVMKVIADKRIGVEMCPISNYQTKSLAPGSVYPIREFSKAGVLVTVNTDNRLVSNTSIAKEMEFLNNHFGITEDELCQFRKNAVEVAFCDDTMKHKLWKLFNQEQILNFVQIFDEKYIPCIAVSE